MKNAAFRRERQKQLAIYKALDEETEEVLKMYRHAFYIWCAIIVVAILIDFLIFLG